MISDSFRRIIIGSLLILTLPALLHARTFTDRHGRTVDAEILKVEGEIVSLELPDGKSYEVPLSTLSEADQAFARAWTAPAAAAPPVETGSPAAPWDFSPRLQNSSGLDTASFRIWLPDSGAKVRGMIVLVPGANGDGRGQVNDESWQNLAGELGFGLIACFFKDKSAGVTGYSYAHNGSGAALLDAIDEFANTQGHPELKDVPLLLWGHSAGGQFNYNFACWKPERTLAFVVNKGGYYYDTRAKPSTRKVPAILFAGANDKEERTTNITNLFSENRSKGALWALCLEPNEGHGVGRSKTVTQEFFRSVTAQRLPMNAMGKVADLKEEQGWLGDLGSKEITAAGQFKGSARKAAWLPDEKTAGAWQASVR